ncbi:hypothetical protein IF655_08415 [Streptomyces sp. DSM 110735]|nr:DUF3616 domain-containing protein [Streptomyces sp. DSM 110735]MBJ7903322.1 hypothetical protein [Streptomyces sp. DSM 110735]
MRPHPSSLRSLWTVAALALVSAAAPLLPTAPAAAASYGTPTIKLSAGYLSGAVGASGDPVVTATVAQSGASASDLTVAASKTSRSAVAGTGDVQVTGAGETRTVAVTAHAQGYTDLTLKVTGLGGKTATATLHYAASPAVQHSADARYLTGASDASAAVDAGNGYLLVANDEDNTLRLYDGSSSGAPVRSWDLSSALGADKEVDIEGGTRIGNTVYWTGSLGNNKDGAYKPARNTVFTTTLSGSGAATSVTFGTAGHRLRDDLVAWDQANGDRYGFAAATADGQTPKQVDGLNVEGLEFAPGSTTTAYLGFRAPLVPPQEGGKALLVPVTNMDQVVRGTKATFGTPVELDLGGLSVRDLRLGDQGQYLILAGSWAAEDNSAPYALYTWDGVAGHQPVKALDLPTADAGGWESIVTTPDLSVPGGRVQLITDDGSADLYGDGTEAKDLSHPEWQKSRTTWFTLN